MRRRLGAVFRSTISRISRNCLSASFPAPPFRPGTELLSFEERERVARGFVGLGVRKLRLTGGEPLLRRDLPRLVARLAGIPGVEDLALTTNGALLKEAAAPLREAGLRRVTVSLDTLRPERFQELADTSLPLRQVLDGIAAAKAAGLGPVKLNCVLQRGTNEEEILDLAAFAREGGHVLRFIEFMDVGTANGWRLDDVVPAARILEVLRTRWDLVPLEEPLAGRVAERWRYRDGGGEMGIVASVTQPFCAGCDRARLSAEGRLYTCLFASEGLDLKTALRNGASDQDLAALVGARWSRREDRYSELRSRATPAAPKVEMHHIGG